MTHHESTHSLLLDAFLFLLLLSLRVRMPQHNRLVALADLERHAAMELLKVLSMLQNRIQIFLQGNEPTSCQNFS